MPHLSIKAMRPSVLPARRKLKDVPLGDLDKLLALTRATAHLLHFHGVDVPLAIGTAPPSTLAEACRVVEVHVAAERLHRWWIERADVPATGLTGRMADVLKRLLTGASEKEIAAWLAISVHTVHVYVRAIYRSYGVHSRGELMAIFLTDAQ